MGQREVLTVHAFSVLSCDCVMKDTGLAFNFGKRGKSLENVHKLC